MRIIERERWGKQAPPFVKSPFSRLSFNIYRQLAISIFRLVLMLMSVRSAHVAPMKMATDLWAKDLTDHIIQYFRGIISLQHIRQILDLDFHVIYSFPHLPVKIIDSYCGGSVQTTSQVSKPVWQKAKSRPASTAVSTCRVSSDSRNE
jgi:hypothetical protein